jgi:hypothetical protein
LRWEKKGLVYGPDGSRPWARTHAFPPTPHLREDGALRIYVGFCDEGGVGRVGWVDIDPAEPSNVLGVSSEPALDIGSPGAFDENGVLPLSIVAVGEALYLYYVGFQLGQKVRHYQFSGLAVSHDGGASFERVSRVPVLDRTDAELLNRNSPFVLLENGTFRMWYAAGSDWTTVNERLMPIYDLRYIESPDGVAWPDEGRRCFELAADDEDAHGKPWVFRADDGYRMLYSIRTRSRGYRLGYAASPDGIEWTRRDDEVGIDVSPSGWDSQMIGYPAVFQHRGTTTLFYNGNELGRTGFGYAVLVQD